MVSARRYIDLLPGVPQGTCAKDEMDLCDDDSGGRVHVDIAIILICAWMFVHFAQQLLQLLGNKTAAGNYQHVR